VKIEAQPTTPIDWDKPIETTEGLPARLLSSDYRLEGETFMLVQIEYDHRSKLSYWEKNGTPYWPSEGRIRNRKTKRKGWVVIFPDRWAGMIWESEEAAQRHPDTKRAIDIVKIEWEE
jgi:hypothetical protein